ncbi:hypothetical protein PsorP6_011962 [Peronosclerospora sorghi]|uniref:Uncharacterized protein n=1 Tax=Peronosclerospora sorghi TaxID=230839 RepID=A0ACC0WHZ9_9STRA|nr:hypothetical protein PsorP6_011962 [Peronosclerospora sorghi]
MRLFRVSYALVAACASPVHASDATRAAALATSTNVIEATNVEYHAGTKRYFLGYNERSDWTDAQYRAFLGSRPDPDAKKRRTKRGTDVAKRWGARARDNDDEQDEDTSANVPLAVDWRTREGGKYVTPIKNQGTCGSCWAFAGVSVVESRVAIASRVPASILSVEQVLSCSAALDHVQSKFPDKMTSSSKGCDGGMPFLTYAYLKFLAPHGMACDRTYPYVMATHESETQCRRVTTDHVAVAWDDHVSDYKVVAPTERALLRAVAQGPVTANLDALGDGFRHYAGGIYDARDCQNDGEEVNHAVVIVGFGETAAGDEYWILRNTWGTMWGEDGYMRIARGRTVSAKYGPCNLYVYADYPVNLTLGSHATRDGTRACAAVPTHKFVPLACMDLMRLARPQLVLLVLASVASLGIGVALYHGTEWRQARKQAAGTMTMDDQIARWVLPSREQIAAAVARRHSRRRARPAST